jgi:hypothetical protein
MSFPSQNFYGATLSDTLLEFAKKFAKPMIVVGMTYLVIGGVMYAVYYYNKGSKPTLLYYEPKYKYL